MVKKGFLWLAFVLYFGTNTVFGGTITKEFKQEYQFKSGEVVVETVNGKIDLETWDQKKVKVFAEIEVKAKTRGLAEKFMEMVEIVVEKSPGKLVIRLKYPKLHKGDNFFDWIIGSRKPQVSVDFLIVTPVQMDVDLKSVNGSVEVVKLKGHATLRTVNGKIHADDIDGSVDAKTTNGGIYVEISKLAERKDMSFRSVNGGIQVYLPDDIEADVKISTVNGGIHTDFPITVKGKWGSKKIRGQINGGGELIELSTVNGGVSLYKR